jgi:hypothetical protein
MKKAVALILIACVLFSTIIVIHACEFLFPPYREKFEVDDGEKIFIMLDLGIPYKQFEKTGLYYNFEPYEAIYTIDERFDFHHFVSSDGLYIVGMYYGLFYYIEEQTWENPAIIFYSSGELIRSYELSDLPINYQDMLEHAIEFSNSRNQNRVNVSEDAISQYWANKAYTNWFDWNRTMLCSESNVLSVFTEHRRWIHGIPTVTDEVIINFDITTGHIIPDGGFATGHALIVLSHAAGLAELSEVDSERYDLNGDGVVDTADALIILRIIAGLE